jgi:hypothetical protein
MSDRDKQPAFTPQQQAELEALIDQRVHYRLRVILDKGLMYDPLVIPQVKVSPPTVTVGQAPAPTTQTALELPAGLKSLLKFEVRDGVTWASLLEHAELETWRKINDDMKKCGYNYTKGKGWTR